MSKQPRIAFLVLLDSEFGRDIAHGVAEYANQHGPWEIAWDYMLDLGSPGPRADAMTLADVDGIIAPFRTPEMAAHIRAAAKPTVAVASYDVAEGMPAVMTDEPKIGHMVAEHFLAQGFTHFGYYNHVNQGRLIGRLNGFRELIEQAGHSVSIHKLDDWPKSPLQWYAAQQKLKAWLASLPQPTAVMAINDLVGRDILSACLELNIRVPEDLAVIGVDDDTPLCLLNSPPMSSVEHGAEQIGYQAAALLDKLMRGEPAPAEPILVPPVRIIERQSSDILAVDDPAVADAVRFIRNHIAEGIQVSDVLAEVPVSRSTLEKAFRKRLQRTIHEEITRVQIARAKELLVNTDLSMQQIATHCGFKYISHLSAAFKRRTQLTCTAYRKQFRLA